MSSKGNAMEVSVGTLVVGMWSRFQLLKAADDAQLNELISEYGSELALMEAIGESADCTHDIVTEDVNFNKVNCDFAMAYLDAKGLATDSLDAAIWDAIYHKRSTLDATQVWLKANMAYALYPES